ncbi:MAG: YdcF family protein [Pseudomonadota bacterium]
MSFVAGKLVGWIADPGAWLLLLLLAAVAAGWTRRPRLAQRLVLVAASMTLILAVLPVGRWLLLPLEDRFPPPLSLPAPIDGIIVLGGAIDSEVSAGRRAPSLNPAGERLIVGAMLARAHPEARLVFSGGSNKLLSGAVPEADFAERLLLDWGVPPARLTIERASRTTRENAVNLTAMLAPKPGENWLLVTSAWHMPRAVGCFRKLGWTVVPYPVDYRTSGGPEPLKPLDPIQGADELSVALHEWLGLVAYRLIGATDALFPGP